MGSETTPHPGRYLSPYARSKHQAGQIALADADSLGLELVVVNPSSVQGPGRTHGSARIFISFLRVFDSSKAERELGLQFTPPEEWLAETVAWYRAEGVV